jgi:hypothetical protein
MSRISDFPAGTPQPTDLHPIVDTTDHSQAPTGTDKKVTWSQLITNVTFYDSDNTYCSYWDGSDYTFLTIITFDEVSVNTRISVPGPTDPSDAANKAYVDGLLGDAVTYNDTSLQLSYYDNTVSTPITGIIVPDIECNNLTVNTAAVVPTPSLPAQATNKSYVDDNFCQIANNLSDVADRITSVENLGVPQGADVIGILSPTTTYFLPTPLPPFNSIGFALPSGIVYLPVMDSTSPLSPQAGRQTVILNNGGQIFTVAYNGGTTIVNIHPSQVGLFWAVSNSTSDGVWSYRILGTLSSQQSNAVTITGGTINNTQIGNTTPSDGSFTTLAVSSTATGQTPTLSNQFATKGYADSLTSNRLLTGALDLINQTSLVILTNGGVNPLSKFINFNISTPTIALRLPAMNAANSMLVGDSFTVYNGGTLPYPVNAQDGFTLLTTIEFQNYAIFTLTDNSTPNGTFDIRFTSIINNGVIQSTPIGTITPDFLGYLVRQREAATTTDNTTATDCAGIVYMTVSGAKTFTLNNQANLPVPTGYWLKINNLSSSGNITVQIEGTDVLIAGSTTIGLLSSGTFILQTGATSSVWVRLN